jgi:hypothetical protein
MHINLYSDPLLTVHVFLLFLFVETATEVKPWLAKFGFEQTELISFKDAKTNPLLNVTTWTNSPIMGQMNFVTATKVKMTLEEDAAPTGNVTIHKLNWPAAGQCGEMTISSKDATFPVKFGGFKNDGCSTDGYTVSQGTKQECSPKVAGKQWCMPVAIYTKATITATATKQ